jgi:photosystem II stability/assembly factor-like uncharacterized protein
MKKILYILLLLLTQSAFAQFNELVPWNSDAKNKQKSIDKLNQDFKTYFSTHDMFAKSSGMKPYMRWKYVWENYFTSDGFKPISTINKAFAQKEQMARNTQDNSAWVNIGPSRIRKGGTSADKGRVNVILVDSNSDQIIYAGTPAGGLWKSTNAGIDWTPLTDHLPQIGVSAIALSPTDHNTIYIGTGDDDARRTYSRGVYKSVDGGITWQGIGPNFASETEVISEIIIHPANPDIIFVASSDGLYKTIDGGTTWQNKLQINAKEMRMHPTNPDIIYTVSGSSFYKSIDGGENFTQITLSSTAYGRLVIDVTPAAPDNVYVATSRQNGDFSGLYISNNTGDSFTKTSENSNIFGQRNQTWYDFAIAVSDNNPNDIYIGNVDIYYSSNGGDSFTQFNHWNTVDEKYTHADIHFLRFYNHKLYVGSDGGVYRSNNDQTRFRGLNRNLIIGQFYRISIANEQRYQIFGGLQDNGGYARKDMNWRVWHGGDGMDNVISNRNNNTAFSFLYYGNALFKTTDGGMSISNTISIPSGEMGNWVTPLAINGNNHVFAGFKKLYKLRGSTWQALTTNEFSSNIQTITCDPQQPDHIYVAVGWKLYKSTDGGVNFTELFDAQGRIKSIAVNSTNHKIWCTASGRVWESSDDGNTWNNITGNLPGENLNVIRYLMFSPNNSLYLGSDLGVYYRDDTTNGWQIFSADLPNTLVYDLEINYDQGLLVAGTHGRGVWETPITVYLPAKDAKLKAITGNSGHLLECNGEPNIKFVVENKGTETIHQFDVTYTIDGVPQTENWSGSLSANQTTEITPANQNWTEGSHFIEAKVILTGDQLASNNIMTKNIVVNHDEELPYLNTFEDATDDAIINYSDNNNSSWELANPSGANLNKTGSGNKAYCTNANGTYNNDTKDYLLSPCYDLTQLSNPEISFIMAHDIEKDYDAFYVEYTIDSGNTWQILGAYGDRKWYNSESSEGACVGGQWTGTNLSMNTYKHDLSFINNEPSVIFRFVMASDPLSAQEGVVIDQLKIAEKLNTNSKLLLYPNPTDNEVKILWNQIKPQHLNIVNLQGMIIYEQRVNAGSDSVNINISSLSKGIYLINLYSKEDIITKKLIIK